MAIRSGPMAVEVTVAAAVASASRRAGAAVDHPFRLRHALAAVGVVVAGRAAGGDE